MVGINEDGTLARIPTHRDRNTARELKLPLYEPDTPCPKHPDSPWYTAIDRCATCHNTTPRVR
jgi:hypothetical protein